MGTLGEKAWRPLFAGSHTLFIGLKFNNSKHEYLVALLLETVIGQKQFLKKGEPPNFGGSVVI